MYMFIYLYNLYICIYISIEIWKRRERREGSDFQLLLLMVVVLFLPEGSFYLSTSLVNPKLVWRQLLSWNQSSGVKVTYLEPKLFSRNQISTTIFLFTPHHMANNFKEVCTNCKTTCLFCGSSFKRLGCQLLHSKHRQGRDYSMYLSNKTLYNRSKAGKTGSSKQPGPKCNKLFIRLGNYCVAGIFLWWKLLRISPFHGNLWKF